MMRSIWHYEPYKKTNNIMKPTTKHKWLVTSFTTLAMTAFHFFSGNDAQATCLETPSTAQDSYEVRVTVGDHTLTATLEDNATTRAFVEMLPLTLPMLDLYGREMCYRFTDALPTDAASTQGYEVGEIVYYPPRHSFVILYAQNGERFQMQKMGRIDSGVEIFDGIGNVEVTFELVANAATAVTSAVVQDVSVRTSGNKVVIEGEGLLRAKVYAASGALLGVAAGDGSTEIDCRGHNGSAIVEVSDSQNNVTRTKVMI